MRRSSHSRNRVTSPFFIAPTAAIDSGQMSRISRTNRTRFSQWYQTPAQPQKNCGEVDTTTSGRGSQRADQTALSM